MQAKLCFNNNIINGDDLVIKICLSIKWLHLLPEIGTASANSVKSDL